MKTPNDREHQDGLSRVAVLRPGGGGEEPVGTQEMLVPREAAGGKRREAQG